MRGPLLLLSALLALSVTVAACGEQEGDGGGGGGGAAQEQPSDGGDGGQQGFTVQLEELNGSGAQGTAELSQLGNTLRVQIEGQNFEPNEDHLAHIHSLGGNEQATCPTEELDENGDGVIDIGEGGPAYGEVAVELAPPPKANGQGDISFQGTFDIESSLEPLTNQVIVVHGGRANGNYDPSLPVACGQIEEA